MADRTFTLKFLADIQDLTKKVGNIDDSVKGMQGKVAGYGRTITGALTGAAVIGFGKQVVSAASDQEQAVGALSSVFKDHTDEMDAFGKTTAQNMGISRAEFSQSAATMGALLKNAGMPLNEVADSTKGLTTRAADLAAMYGGTVPEAMDAMKSALKGEMDPLEKYGVSLKASAIEARAVADGHVDATGKATDYGKAMAAQALIMEQSADSAGTFTKESGSAAGQQAILTAQFKDMSATIGQTLLPIIVTFTKVLVQLVTFVQQNQGWLIPLAAGIGAVVLAIKAYQLAQAAWSVATKIATGAQMAFNAVMMANPIVLVIAAIVAIIAIIVVLYMKVDWFRAFVDKAIDGIVAAWNWLLDAIKKVFNWVKENWPLLLAIITGPFGAVVAIVVKNWDTIKAAIVGVFNWIKTNWPLLLAIITGPFGLAVLAIQRNWDSIVNAARGVVNGVRTALNAIVDVVGYPFRKGVEAAKSAWESLMSVFRGAYNAITYALSRVANAITDPFKKAISGIKSLWNSTIGKLSFKVPSWVPGIGGKGWTAPKLAKGGIVTRPTVALIGEAGPEAVIPLSGSAGVGFGAVTINVYALTANAEVGRKVYEALREYDRANGRIA